METIFRDLPAYLTWANGLALKMVRDNETPELVALMAHIVAAESIWANRVLRGPVDSTPRPDWDLAECERRIPLNAALLQTIVDSMDSDVDVQFTTIRGDAYSMSVGSLVLQLVTHGSYHRGQITQDVRQRGGEIIDTDYFLFQLAKR